MSGGESAIVEAIEQDKRWFAGSPGKDSARDLLSGMISGFFCKTFEYPFDTIKVLQQTGGKSEFNGSADAFFKTYQRGGVRALYQGLTSPLLGAMAENATLFVAYGAMKNALQVDPSPTLSNPVPVWKYLVAGGGSGVFSAFVLTPVELVKCRLQIQQSATTKTYSGPIDVVRKTVQKEGVRGLWKGNLSCLAREVPGNIAWFGVYEIVRNQIQRVFNYERQQDVPLYWIAFSGACAGVAYWAVPYPADTIKSVIQTNPKFSGMNFFQAGSTILRTQGLAGLYNGLPITCIRAAPSHALIFYFYELTSGFLATL
ncbi:Mitochondrial substrate carrier family protein S [Hondaea fermentalgiana]|uniref:Mitochondrial substrate carrier family protein S n=1 Tax=Hondaea fermentalgiana TaxID=2315210 RepID=A0A2R5GFK4_9STRA|nr:Mitochondrial substrate carrier family protein S [Hondaea fermentalgiana]|eukprot:GBG29109.1 Mitochondrial substrate carrier family protein S [Hondaea fermentalgiana]